MLFRTRGGTAAVTLLFTAAALATAAAGASCASQGQGTNETFTDGSADGTQEEASSSSSGGSGSGSGSSSSSGGGSGCDADTTNDPYNCGSCGHHCPQGNICSCSTCMAPCSSGMATCCGACANLMTDPQNCGTCNNACQSTGTGDTPGCTGGHCTFTCPEAGPEGGTIITCGADSGSPGCYDPSSSPQACGGCGNVCPSGSCVNAVCQDASVPTTGYTASTPTLPFIDACSLPGHTTSLVSQSFWKNTGTTALPFSFTYYGQAQTQYFIGSQGTFFFGAVNGGFAPSQPSDCTMNWPPPTFPPPDPTQQYPEVLPFGDINLATGMNGVCVGVVSADAGTGDAGGGDQLVVTWSQATLNNDPGSVLTFSIVLTQGTNTIDFLYQTMANGDGGSDTLVQGVNATVGMQALHINPYTPYSCTTTFVPSTPFAVRFTPH
ncbi:MAG TPA: hypothetical protein VF765_08855 [Polyangiaceae bacterium]